MGRAVARQLAEKGANIIIVARDEVKLAEATKYISVCRTPYNLISSKLY
jgi:short-subunit dehydrogenase